MPETLPEPSLIAPPGLQATSLAVDGRVVMSISPDGLLSIPDDIAPEPASRAAFDLLLGIMRGYNSRVVDPGSARRWSPAVMSDGMFAGMHDREDGEYVLLDDYLELKRRFDAARRGGGAL